MFFGREDLLAQLDALWGKSVSSLVTCRGRRRIGKSALVAEFARQSGGRFIRIEGRKPDAKLTNAHELAAFARQLSRCTGAKVKTPDDWTSAFDQLAEQIPKAGRTVVLLDEVSWLAHYDESFADTLKMAWDSSLKNHDRLILVLCGSVSTWIRENIIDNSAYLGRRSLDIIVPELPISDCVRFWGRKAKRTDPREILDVLSVTGGVPRYLEEINPSLGAEENIRRLCFSPKGVLRTDFDEMFRDVMTKHAGLAERLLRTLVSGPKNAAEMARQLGLEKGGNAAAALRCLEESGFVSTDMGRNPETGGEVRERRYRLADNYSRFYFKYIEPVRSTIDAGAFVFSSAEILEGWDSVMGLAFENLVINNYRHLLPFLHLDGALILSASPYRRVGARSTTKERGQKGVQIDLLIQTRRMLYVVEIKRQRRIERSVIDEVEAKVESLNRPRGMSVKTALVYDGELSPLVKADGYFDAVVPFCDLMGIQRYRHTRRSSNDRRTKV